MASPIRKLPVFAYVKMMLRRNKKIAAAPENAPETAATANLLADRLHPTRQYLKVARVEDHGSAKSYYLAPDREKGTESLAWFSAGQYLSIRLQIGDMTITRPYSLSSSPRQDFYRITVKAVEGGLASQYILDTWQPGTAVTASGPLGSFTYEPLRDAKTVVGIAGGSGITPFVSLARSIAEGDEDADLILLYGSRTWEDALFRQELAELAQCPRIRVVHVLSHEQKEGCEEGFLTARLIQKYAPEGEYSLFMCGPQAMYGFLEGEIAQLDLRQKFIRRELFGEVFRPGEKEVFQITVLRGEESQTVTAPADRSVLRSLEEAGLSVPSHCRSGECGWCHSRLLSGRAYTPENADGRRAADGVYGYIHPCCSFPLSDLTIQVPPTAE